MILPNLAGSPADIDAIHETALKILATKGVRMPYQPAQEILRSAGARVEDRIVYYEPELISRALSSAPKTFVIRARNPKFDFEIGGAETCFSLPHGPIKIKKGDEYRPSKSEDVVNFLKLAETSDVLTMADPWVATATDVPADKQTLYQLALALKYSTKPIVGLTDGYEHSKMSINLLRDFYDRHAEDDHVGLGLISPISPLSYDDRMLEALIAYVEENQPMLFASCVLPGATGPITLAGALTLAHAEVLAGIVLAQLIRPGVPVIYGNAAGAMDPRYVTPAIGTPEAALTAIYAKSLADKLGVPSRAGGSLADAKQNDAQSGIEATTVMLATVQAGINFVMHSAGILDSYNVISYDKFLLDEEMTKMALRVRQGVPVDEDTLAYETILDVDHGEQYLTEDHTFEFMRSSLHVSKYFQKSGYASWEQDGKQTAQGNALEALEQRLAAYQETPLTEAQGALIAPYLTY